MSFRTVLADPMLRMLVAAIALAALLPATGDARSAAQMIANAAIFVLFLLNGMRIARRDIAAGIANWRFLLPLVLWVFGAMALAGLALAHAGCTLRPSGLACAWLAGAGRVAFALALHAHDARAFRHESREIGATTENGGIETIAV